MPLVVCLSGLIGSGKSSVGHALSGLLGWRRAAFGDYLRSELTRQGKDSSSRKALQDLGQTRVDTDAEGFCQDVLRHGGYLQDRDFIVDGVRHTRVYEMLKQITHPARVRLIFLVADETVRMARAANRPGEISDFERASAHLVESESNDQLQRVADLKVDATKSIEAVVAKCVESIFQWSDDTISPHRIE